jgi:hypothetical protein
MDANLAPLFHNRHSAQLILQHSHPHIQALTPSVLLPMAKVDKSKIGMPTKTRKAAKSVAASNPSLPALQQLQDSGKKANLNSGGTRRNYDGYVK